MAEPRPDFGTSNLVKVRLGRIADIARMIDLERGCETAAHWSEAQYRSAFAGSEDPTASRVVLVIDADAETLPEPDSRKAGLVGFLVASHRGFDWELENIAVAPALRRDGVGSQLLQELCERARAAESESIHLEVRESNHAARRFYAKSGFEEIGRRRGYYAVPPEDAVLYRLMLR